MGVDLDDDGMELAWCKFDLVRCCCCCCCGVDMDDAVDVDPKSIRLPVGAEVVVLAAAEDERC